MSLKISELLDPAAIVAELKGGSKNEVLAELTDALLAANPKLNRTEVLRVLREREQLGSTGIGDGVAIPHGKLRNFKQAPVLVFGRSIKGVDFNSLDARKAHLFFLMLAADDAVDTHLRMLARLSRILKDPAVRKALLEAADAGSIHSIIAEQERRF